MSRIDMCTGKVLTTSQRHCCRISSNQKGQCVIVQLAEMPYVLQITEPLQLMLSGRIYPAVSWLSAVK